MDEPRLKRDRLRDKVELIVFDMDGVLVDVDSSWDFVHKSLNVDSGENIRRYLSGQIDYKEFMRRDIQLWGTIHVNTIQDILDKVPLMTGASDTLGLLRAEGYRTAILSAGISLLARRVQSELRIDFAFANELAVNTDGVLTGEGVEVVNLLDKASALSKLASQAGVSPRNCAVVGDSIFDVPLFKEAMLSFAFNTRDERVRAGASVVIRQKDLRWILPYFERTRDMLYTN